MNSARLVFLRIALCLLPLLAGTQAWSASVTWFSAGGRYHTGLEKFEDYPFRSGDISYQVGMEFHEGIGYWQLVLGYAPSVGENSDPDAPRIDSVITPQLNLLLQDRGWLAGTGILASYIKDENEKDWTSIYWQTMIGYTFNFQYFNLEVLATHVFEEWSFFTDFSFNRLEYSAMLKRRF